MSMPPLGPVDPNPAAGIACLRCGVPALVMVVKLVAKPIGSFSLAGVTDKVSAYRWPFVLCDPARGGCGAECKGKR